MEFVLKKIPSLESRIFRRFYFYRRQSDGSSIVVEWKVKLIPAAIGRINYANNPTN